MSAATHQQVLASVGHSINTDGRTSKWVLTLEIWPKGSNVPSISLPVPDEEWMRPGHWLGSVLCFLSALTLFAGKEGYPAHKKPVPQTPKVLFWNKWRKKTKENN